jgi:hypothetical protein
MTMTPAIASPVPSDQPRKHSQTPSTAATIEPTEMMASSAISQFIVATVRTTSASGNAIDMPVVMPEIMPVCVADQVQSNEYWNTVLAVLGVSIDFTNASARASIGSLMRTAWSNFIVIFAPI